MLTDQAIDLLAKSAALRADNIAGLAFDRRAWVIGNLLKGADQPIERRGLAGVRRADERG